MANNLTCNAELWKGNRQYVSPYFVEEAGVGMTVRCGDPVLSKCGQLYLCTKHAQCEMERLNNLAYAKEQEAMLLREIAENIRQQFAF